MKWKVEFANPFAEGIPLKEMAQEEQTRNFDELVSRMSPASRQRAEARAGVMLQEMALADLRRARSMSQSQLAEGNSAAQCRQ